MYICMYLIIIKLAYFNKNQKKYLGLGKNKLKKKKGSYGDTNTDDVNRLSKY